MEKKRTRKPNWTEEQCLLLAQLINEHKSVLRGKFSPSVTVQAKKQAWDTIAQQINASFPLVVRTSEDCEKRWYVLQSKAKEEIAAQKREEYLSCLFPPPFCPLLRELLSCLKVLFPAPNRSHLRSTLRS